jgi:rod shape-determining protein MreC
LLALIKRYRELILVAILLLVPLGVFFAHAKRSTELSRVDRVVLAITSPVEKLVSWVVTGALRGWYGYVALRGARQEAVELSRRVNMLEIERAQLVQERTENQRLQRLLGFAQAYPERTYVGARVIGVRLGPAGRQLVTIDRGSDDGIARMQPVITADGVVGRVHSVASSSADVLLLVDRDSSIGVRVERTRARANVRGTGKPDGAKLEYALRTEDVIEGDPLVTSGTDGVFPRGLPVGKVTRLKRSPQGLFQDAVVVPAVDVTRLEEVLVVTSAERPPEQAPAALAPAHAPARGKAP